MMTVYLGEDTYRSKEACHDACDALQKLGVQLGMFDAGSCSVADIATALRSQDLFSVSASGIVLSGALTHKKFLSEVTPLLLAAPASAYVLLWEGVAKEDLLKDAQQFLSSCGGTVEEFAQQTGKAMQQWIGAQVQSQGCTIAPAATALLQEATQNDTQRLVNEIAKLTAYAHGREITSVDVALLVSDAPQDAAFAILDAIAEKKFDRASVLLREQLQTHEPLPFFALFAKHLRSLASVRSYLSQPGAQKQAMARTLGLHPYVAQKIASHAQTFSPQILLSVLPFLFDADRAMKTGRASPEEMIDLLVAKLAAV